MGKKRKRSEKSKKSSKKRKYKGDPPKRPKTAFFLFMDDHRKDLMADDQFKKDGKGKSEGTRVCDITKIGKELGRMWKALEEDEQGPYKKKAAKLKAKYDKEKEKYDGGSKKKSKRRKRKVSSSSESESESSSESESD